MRSPFQVFDDWAEDEDEEVMSNFRRHYGPLLQISLMFPSWKPSMRLVTVSMFILYTILFGAHLVLLLFSVAQAVLEWNLELASLCLHFALILCFGLFIIYYLLNLRKLLVRQCKIMAGDVGRYRSGRIYDDDWYVEEQKRSRKETIHYLVLPAAIGIVSGYIMFGPYITNWITEMGNPYTPRMINMNLPFPCWYPFPTHEGALHLAVVVVQITTAAFVSVIIVQILLMFLINTQRIRLEMRVIVKRKRACVPPLLPKSVLISIYADEVDVTAAISFSVGTGVIGLSLFNILEALKTNNYTTVSMFGLMIVCEILVMYVLAALGEAVTDESIKLRNQLYFVKWHNLDTKNKKILLNFHTAMTEPVVVRAMGIVDLSMDTFSNIMNTAYSFFNLMNAQN